MTITENELYSALREYFAEDSSASDETFTRRELQEVMGWGEQKTRDRIRELAKAGEIENVQSTRYDLTGRPYKERYAFRFVKKEG